MKQKSLNKLLNVADRQTMSQFQYQYHKLSLKLFSRSSEDDGKEIMVLNSDDGILVVRLLLIFLNDLIKIVNCLCFCHKLKIITSIGTSFD